MSDEEIRLDQTLENSALRPTPLRAEPSVMSPTSIGAFGQFTDKEMPESLREPELKTGEQLIFRPDEPGPGVS
jgi:hypothetical protein